MCVDITSVLYSLYEKELEKSQQQQSSARKLQASICSFYGNVYHKASIIIHTFLPKQAFSNQCCTLHSDTDLDSVLLNL